MKRIISILLALLLALSAFPVCAIAADSLKSGDWEYTVVYEENGEQRIEIVHYYGTDETVTVPSEIDGLKVVGFNSTQTGWYSFNKTKNVVFPEGIEYIDNCFLGEKTSVVLPSTLRYLGQYAFTNVVMDTLTLPEGLEGIATMAFDGCAVERIILPESLKYIGYSAFNNCTLDSVYIGKNAKICDLAYTYPSAVSENDAVNENWRRPPFYTTTGLKSIEVAADSLYLCSVGNVLYSKNKDILWFVGEGHMDFTVPDSVEKLGDFCFKERNLGTVHFGAGLWSVGQYSLTNVKSIDKLTFASDAQLSVLDAGAFASIAFSAPFVLPKSVETIGESAFAGCQFSSFSVEEGSLLQCIGKYAFAKSNLKTVDFSMCPILNTFSIWCFSNCTELESVNLENTLINYIEDNAFNGDTALRTVLLPRFCTELYDGVFYNCSSLELVHCDNYCSYLWPDTFKNSNPTAFQRGTGASLGTVTIGDFTFNEYENYAELKKYNGGAVDFLEVPSYVSGKPVTRIVDFAFGSKNEIGELVLPSTLVYLQQYVINDNVKSLRELPESLIYIADQAWVGSSFANGLTLGNQMLYVGFNVFGGAQYDTLELSDSLLLLKDGNLHDGIKTVRFGAGMNDIERALCKDFDYLYEYYTMIAQVPIRYQLGSIEVSADNPYYSSVDGVLYNKDKTVLICYPANKTDEVFMIPDSVKTVAAAAFGNTKYLKKLIVSPSVSGIEDYAFYQSSLQEVVIEDGGALTTLGGAFYGSNVENVSLGSDVRIINAAFKGVPLKEVHFSEGIETIGKEAFAGTPLEAVYFPSSVSMVMAGAFAGCTALADVYLKNARYLGAKAFCDCTALESIDLTGVRFEIQEGYATFEGCTNLKKLYFTKEEREAYIAEHEFSGNETLQEIVIGGAIEEIQDGAFENCTNLETAFISSSVKTIAHNAFSGCTKLTIVTTEDAPALAYALENNIACQTVSTFVVSPIPDQIYTGKEIKPALSVKQGGKPLLQGKDYKATYRDNVEVGTAKVAVNGMGDYSIFGTTVKFRIVQKEKPEEEAPEKPSQPVTPTPETDTGGGTKPTKVTVKRVSIIKCTKKKKSFTVKWKKLCDVSGYQVQYTTKKSYKGAKTKTVSAKKKALTVKKLKAKKKYYIRVRAYKKTANGRVFGKWSKTKSVKTK